MPVEFLSDEQAARYGRYQADPNAEQLTRYFYLSPADEQFLAQRRRAANKLGCAVQLGTLRFLGTFLPEPTQVLGSRYNGAENCGKGFAISIGHPEVIRRRILIQQAEA